jgi:hypothetical protein
MPVLGSLASNPPAGFFNVKNFGAVGDNSHDDTAAIQAAANAVKAAVLASSGSAGGNTLYFPPGFYKTTARLDFTGMQEVRFLGYCGRGGWRSADANPPTVINYVSGGSVTAVDLGGSHGVIWDGVSVWANGSSFTGKLMSFDALAIGDIFGSRVQNCQLRVVAGSGAVLLSLDGNIEFSADNVTFADSPDGVQVQGFDSVNGHSKWSNANSFRSCSFIGTRSFSGKNTGPQTTWIDCTFESAQGGVAAPIIFTALGQAGVDVQTFIGCGFWDVTAGSTPWIQSTVASHAFTFTGCRFDCAPDGPTIALSSHSGIALSGCFFNAPGGGTPNILDPSHTISGGSMLGCYVQAPAVDNHVSVFV